MQGIWLAAAELAVIAAIYIADRYGFIPLSNTPFLLIFGWISLRLRRFRWRDVGFVRPDNWLRAMVIGSAAGVAMELFAYFAAEPLIARLTGTHPDLTDFRPLVGNLKLLFVFLAFNWTLAAFGEELVYRGYMLSRIAGFLGGLRGAWAAGLILSSAIFGWAHGESQGASGILQEGFNGLLLGLLYFATGRKLTVPIVAHGVSNTLAFVLIYLGHYAGV